MRIKVFVSVAASVKPELTDDRFTPSQLKKLSGKGAKLILTTTDAYTSKSDLKVTPFLSKNEYLIKNIQVTGTGKLRRIHILKSKDTSRASKPSIMSAATLLKLLNGEKASLKSKKGTKSANLK